jgi:hypothetical protein
VGNCEVDSTTLLADLQSLLRAPDASLPKPFTSNGIENHHNAFDSFHVVVHADDIKVFLKHKSVVSLPYGCFVVLTMLHTRYV